MAARRPSDCAAIDPSDFRTVADDTYDWESWLSPEGELLWVNPSVQRITGFGAQECLAMSDYPLPLVHEEDRSQIAKLLKEALSKTAGNDLEFRIVRKSGESRWVAMSWQSSHNDQGRWLGVRLSIRDIDRRKQLELQLVEALDRAKAADRAKSEFLAMMSHELRTPLHCTSGYTELLLQQDLTEDQRKYLTVIQEQNTTLVHLVDSILQLSAAEEGAPQPYKERTQLGQLVRRLAAAFEAEAALKGLRLTCDGCDDAGIHVYVDAKALQHVLRNLLSNATKFTQQGEVRVALRISARSDGKVQVAIEVSDTGPGIERQHQQNIFAPFVQASSSLARAHGGIGLGLTIARRFAEILGGTLELESDVGQGSRFTLRFPADLASPEETQMPSDNDESTRDGQALAGKRVLVVDDSEANRTLMCEWLRTLGVEVVAVNGGAEALVATQDTAFDMILMDIQMPGLDGTQTTKRLREEVSQQTSYLVALTANRFAKHDAAVVEAGFDEVLTKPIAFAELHGALQRAVSQQGAPAAVNVSQGIPSALDATIVSELRAFALKGDHSTLLNKLGQQVLAAQTGQIENMEQQATSGHWQEVARIAHTLKGNCALVGGTHASQAAAVLIEAIDEGCGQAQLTAEVARFKAALGAFEQLLRAALDL